MKLKICLTLQCSGLTFTAPFKEMRGVIKRRGNVTVLSMQKHELYHSVKGVPKKTIKYERKGINKNNKTAKSYLVQTVPLIV